MSNVYPHPAATVQKGARAARNGGPPGDIIDAIEAIAFSNVEAARFDDAIRDMPALGSVSDDDRMRFYALLCRVWSPWPESPDGGAGSKGRPDATGKSETGRVSRPPAEPAKEDGASRLSADQKVSVKEYVAALNEKWGGVQILKEQYTSFSPAWELRDFLEAEFGPDDPGRVIGRYIDALFDARLMTDPTLGIFVGVTTGRDAAEKSIVRLLELLSCSESTPDVERRVCRTIASFRHDPSRRRETDPASVTTEVLIALLDALQGPQTLLTALLVSIDEWEDFLTVPNGSAGDVHNAIYNILFDTFWRCSAPYVELNDLQRLKDQLLQTRKAALDPDAAHALPERMANPAAMTGRDLADAVTHIPLAAIDALLDAVTDGRRVSCLPPQLLPRILSLGAPGSGSSVWERYQGDCEILDRHVSGGARYRREVLDGGAPFALSDSYYLWLTISHSKWTPDGRSVDWSAACTRDPCYLLSQIEIFWGHPETELADDATLLPAMFGYDGANSEPRRRDRATEYQVLFRLAMDEGLSELAAALQAFFIFSQALRYRGRVGPWHLVQDGLRLAITVDRAGIVTRALEVAIGIADHYQQTLDAQRMRGALGLAHDKTLPPSKAPVAMLGLGTGTRESILSDLRQYIGGERMARWSEGARHLLIDAHAKFAAQHRNLLYGIVANWGSTATDFMKVFESELGARLREIYLAETYRQYKQSQSAARFFAERPSIGHYFHLLKDATRSNFPPVIRANLDKVTSLHRDKRTLERLMKLTENHRNPGSHAEAYDVNQLFDLLNALYRDGFMSAFLDAVIPASDSEQQIK